MLHTLSDASSTDSVIATGDDSSGEDTSDDEDDKNEGAGNGAGAQDNLVTFDDVSPAWHIVGIREMRFRAWAGVC